MKKIFIYYSRTGNGLAVARRMEELGFDIRKVETKLNLGKTFFFQMMKGGFLAGMNKKAKLINYINDISDYDEVVIGSPIWNGNLSCPINTVLAETDFKDKKLSFILYSGSGEGKKAEKRIKKLFPGANIIFMQEPKKNEKELKKLD